MKMYPEEEQKRVKLTRMEDPYTKLVDGDEGTIVGEDDAGHILVKWDRGSSLSLIPGLDEYEILEKKTFRLIKFFEEFTGDNIDFVWAKISELEDLIPSGTNFSYKLNKSSRNGSFQGELNIQLEIFKSNLHFEWCIDLDDPSIRLSKNGEIVYRQKVYNIDESLDLLEKDIHKICGVSERVKSQRYKGRKIPGKYLTKNPGKMKKEIDTYIGKKEYKKDWDADYKSGKGGVGKRVKTKKSAATKAYQRMFGDKEK